MLLCPQRGYGLVVECVLAKDETGVRFSLSAQSEDLELCAAEARRRRAGVAQISSRKLCATKARRVPISESLTEFFYPRTQ